VDTFYWRNPALAVERCLENTLSKVVVDLLAIIKALPLLSLRILVDALKRRVDALVMVDGLMVAHAFNVQLQRNGPVLVRVESTIS
jgi:hypothetical protein